MAVDYNVQGSGTAKQKRNLLLTYVQVGTTGEGASATPVWELQGAGIEDSSIEYNSEINTVHDILNRVETDVEYTEPQQSFEPHRIRTGDQLAAILADIERRKAYEEYSQFNVLVVHAYLADSNDKNPAEIHTNSTIEVSSLGGSSYVEQPFTIHYSNNKTLGTADVSNIEAPVFTAAS